jgi:hypothetical protein
MARFKSPGVHRTLAKAAEYGIGRASSSGGCAMEFETLLLLVPVVYVALQWSALKRMRHGWRYAAAFPVLAMSLALAIFVVGIVTNANMAAMWLVLGLPVATLYLVLLLPLHWLIAKGA